MASESKGQYDPTGTDDFQLTLRKLLETGDLTLDLGRFLQDDNQNRDTVTDRVESPPFKQTHCPEPAENQHPLNSGFPVSGGSLKYAYTNSSLAVACLPVKTYTCMDIFNTNKDDPGETVGKSPATCPDIIGDDSFDTINNDRFENLGNYPATCPRKIGAGSLSANNNGRDENLSNSPAAPPAATSVKTLSTFHCDNGDKMMSRDGFKGDRSLYSAVGDLVEDVIDVIHDDEAAVDRTQQNEVSTTARDDMLQTRYDPTTGECLVRIGHLSYPIDCTGFNCADVKDVKYQSPVSVSSRCHGYRDTYPDTVLNSSISACDGGQWEAVKDSLYDDHNKIDQRSAVSHVNTKTSRSLTNLRPLSLSEAYTILDNAMLNTDEHKVPVNMNKLTRDNRSTNMSNYHVTHNTEQTLPGLLSSIWQDDDFNNNYMCNSDFDPNCTPYYNADCDSEPVLDTDSFLETEAPDTPLSDASSHYRPRSTDMTSYCCRHSDRGIKHENGERSSCSECSAGACVSMETTSDMEGVSRPISNTRSKGKVKRSCRLWEFIRNLLLDPATNPTLIQWEDRTLGTFRLMQSKAIARVWGNKKGNKNMNYEKLSRAMRYYYKRQIFAPVLGKRLVYSFGPRATGWRAEDT